MELSTPLPSSPTSRRTRSRLRCLLFTTKSWTRSVPTRLQQCMRGQGRREKRIHIKSGSLGHLQKETMLGRTVVETKKRTMVERQKRRKEKNPRKKSNSRTQPSLSQSSLSQQGLLNQFGHINPVLCMVNTSCQWMLGVPHLSILGVLYNITQLV